MTAFQTSQHIRSKIRELSNLINQYPKNTKELEEERAKWQMKLPKVMASPSIHLFCKTYDEAKQMADEESAPFFRTFIDGVEMYSVRVKNV